MRRFVPPCHLADALVAGRQQHDDHQGDEEGEGAGDVPLAEDDAEVFR